MGRHVEEVVGLLEVELERSRLVFGREVGEARNVGRDHLRELVDLVTQRRQPRLGSSQIERPRRGVPHVVGGAPSSGICVVDELEFDQPRIEGVIGQGESDPGANDRLTRESKPVTLERSCEIFERFVEILAARPDDRVGLGEGGEHGTQRLYLHRALSSQLGTPVAVVEYRAGQPVDQRRQDVLGRGERAVAADRRRARGGVGERVVMLGLQHRPPTGDRERALVDHLWGDAAAADQANGERGEGCEPCERR